MTINRNAYSEWYKESFAKVSGTLDHMKNGIPPDAVTLRDIFNIVGLTQWTQWNVDLTKQIPVNEQLQKPQDVDLIENKLAALVAIWSFQKSYRDALPCAQAISEVLLDKSAPIRSRLCAHNSFKYMPIWRNAVGKGLGIAKNYVASNLLEIATDNADNIILRTAAFNNLASIISTDQTELKGAYLAAAESLLSVPELRKASREILDYSRKQIVSASALSEYAELMSKMGLK